MTATEETASGYRRWTTERAERRAAFLDHQEHFRNGLSPLLGCIHCRAFLRPDRLHRADNSTTCFADDLREDSYLID